MRAQCFHRDDCAQNADDLQQRPRRENLVEQRHAMLRFLAPMTQLNSKLERLLSPRSFSTLRKLCNLCDRRQRLRVCPQLFDIRFGIFAAHRLLRLGRLLFRFFCQLLSPNL